MRKIKSLSVFLMTIIILLGAVPVFSGADGARKLIALTFDDGPGKYTDELLDGLRERGAFVTFFVLGQNAEYYPDTVRRAWSDGHQICSHTYDHAQLTDIGDERIRSELTKADAAIDAALGEDNTYWLRPPYGSYSDHIMDMAGVPGVYWSVDTLDWQSLDADAAYKAFIDAAYDGAIVLMHDIYKTTVSAALRAVDTLMDQGYEFVTVKELMYERGINALAGKMYFDARPGESGTVPGISKPTVSYERTPDGKRVFISGDERFDIYYTTDGATPLPGTAKRYEGCFEISENSVVNAVSVRDWNGGRSPIASEYIQHSWLDTVAISAEDGRILVGGHAAKNGRVEISIAGVVLPVLVIAAAVFVVRSKKGKKIKI